MNRVRVFRSWVRRYWLALVIAGGFFVSGAVWVLPPVLPFVYSYPQLLVSYIAIPSLGILSFPAFAFYDALASVVETQRFRVYITPKTLDLLLALLLILIFSLVLGFIVWRVLRAVKFRRAIRFILYGNFLLGIGFGFLTLIQGPLSHPDVGPYTLQSTCEIPISKTTRIREEYFDSTRPEHRGLAGIPLFRGTAYFISHNGGETWWQFMHLAPWRGNCEGSRVFNEAMFWLWEWGTLMITHDGGQNWRIWTIHELGGDFTIFDGELTDSVIESVSFTDEVHGQMRLSNRNVNSENDPRHTLVSNDGGLTWQQP